MQILSDSKPKPGSETVAPSADLPIEQPVDLDNLPRGYYLSKNFVGSLIAVCLMADSLYLGYTLPVNSLSAINADLGPDSSYSMISTVSTLLAGVCY